MDGSGELRVLLLEDNPSDAELIQHALRKAGITFSAQRVETREAFIGALEVFAPGIVLADYTLPSFDAKTALRLVRERHPEVPVIIVTGTLGDEPAAELLQSGARDFVLKDRLARLAPAVRRAIAEEMGIRARKAAERAVRESEIRFRRLFETAGDGILIIDTGGVVVDVNSAMENLVGYPRHHLIGHKAWEIDTFKTAPRLGEVFQELLRDTRVRHDSVQVQGADGRLIDCELVSSRYSAGVSQLIQCNLRDVSDRARMERELAQREVRFRALIENTSDIVAVIDREGRISYMSPSVQAVGGYAPEELMGRSLLELIHPDDAAAAVANLHWMSEHPGEMTRSEERYRHKSGAWRTAESISRNLLNVAGINGIVVNLRDITDRKRSEEALRASEASLAEAQAIAHVGSWSLELPSYALTWSAETYRIFGVDPQFFVPSLDALLQCVHPDDRVALDKSCRENIMLGVPHDIEHRIVLPDGRVRVVHERGAVVRDATGAVIRAVGTVQDITERRQAQDALRETVSRVEAQLAAVGVASRAEGLADGDVDLFGRALTEIAASTLGAEQACIRLFDDEQRELQSVDSFDAERREHRKMPALKPEDVRDLLSVLRKERFRAVPDVAAAPQLRLCPTDPGLGSLLVAAIQAGGATLGVLAIACARRRDWTQDEIAFASQLADKVGFAVMAHRRRAMEEQLRRVNVALRTLSDGNSALVHSTEEFQLYRDMCRILVESHSYSGAGVALVVPGQPHAFVAAALAGDIGLGVPEGAVWTDPEAGRNPVCSVVTTGEVQLFASHVNDKAAIGLPLRADGKVFGVLVIYDGPGFSAEERPLLEEFANDLAYGVSNLRARREHDAREVQLRETLEATVHAVAGTVELRDPYTAGHQRRVAHLASAIGTEMGLAADRIVGMHLAATIHDVGKIVVPAEILSRPARLSPIEYEMVKQHAQAGYEIVKNVRFPWPIAEMVRQHHERLDGSGYPRGLKGDEILLEARIIAVADVVESIASHRPYRAALGLDAALAELASGRGSRYDAAAVDACNKLFREKGYVLGS